MWRYVLRRLLQMVPVVLGTTFFIYAMVFALPGDPIRRLAGDKPLPEATYEALRHRHHLDQPLIVQYGRYLAGLFHGDFGETIDGQPVGRIIGDAWPVSVQLAFTAWLFLIVVGMTLGVWAGLRKGGLVDNVVLGATTVVIAVPLFVLGYSAQLLLGLKLGWFPTANTDDGWPMSYLLPGMVLASPQLSYVARLTRTSLAENMRADYVRTAVAKGLTRRRVVGVHMLRNSLIAVVTFLGTDIGALMGGAIVTEGVFNIRGIGGLVFRGIVEQDTASVVGIVVLLVIVYLVANLVVDLLYAVLDPRIRYE